MTTGQALELAIIAFIVIGIAAAIWRGGANNPVGTGGLDRRLTAIGGKVNEIEDRLEDVENRFATREDIDRLEKLVATRLPDIESRQRALADQLADHQRKSAATGSQVKHINRQVDLLVGELIKKGMDK